ncbi:RDD family protein, partial [Pseudomonas sp. ATCC 13867]
WMLWDKNKRTWHDRYSESVVIQIPKAVRKTTQGRG